MEEKCRMVCSKYVCKKQINLENEMINLIFLLNQKLREEEASTYASINEHFKVKEGLFNAFKS